MQNTIYYKGGYMIYKITFFLKTDEIAELENIFEEYNIDYEVNEVYESEVQ